MILSSAPSQVHSEAKPCIFPLHTQERPLGKPPMDAQHQERTELCSRLHLFPPAALSIISLPTVDYSQAPLDGGTPPSTDVWPHRVNCPTEIRAPSPPSTENHPLFHPEPPPLWQRRGLSHHHLTAVCSQPPRTTLLTPWMHSHSSPKLSTAGLLPFLFPKQRDRPAGPTSLPWGRCQGGGGHGTWLGVGCSALTTPLLNNPAVLPPFFLFYP